MKKFIEEFKIFAVQGNFVQMAIGIVVGTAFSSIVTSLVNDVFMPLIACITSDVNFADLSLNLKGDITLNYGNFIQTLINFLIIALCMFLVVKTINKLTIKKEEEKKETAPAPESPELQELKKITALLEKK